MGKGQCYKVVSLASLLTISKLVVKTLRPSFLESYVM
jgi:hypothetical protein